MADTPAPELSPEPPSGMNDTSDAPVLVADAPAPDLSQEPVTTNDTIMLAATPARDLSQQLTAALNETLGRNDGDNQMERNSTSARVDPATEDSAELQAALSLAAVLPAPPSIPANATRKRRRESTEIIPDTPPSALETVPSISTPVRITRSVSRRQAQEDLQGAQVNPEPVVNQLAAKAPPAPPAIPANVARKKSRKSTDVFPDTVPSAPDTVPWTGTPLRITRSVHRRQTQEDRPVAEPESMEGIEAPAAPSAPMAVPANAPRMRRKSTDVIPDAVPSAPDKVPSTGTPVRVTRSVHRRQTQGALQGAQADLGPVLNQQVPELESMEGIEASETIQWRAKEAGFITREINAQKALQELTAQLAEAQKRATSAELQAAQALAAVPPAPSAIPANSPRKRRRKSTEVVPDTIPSTPGTPVRITRSVHRRQTQEALQGTQADPGPVVNQPTAAPRPASSSTEGAVQSSEMLIAHGTRQRHGGPQAAPAPAPFSTPLLQPPVVQLSPRASQTWTNAAGTGSGGTLTEPKENPRNVVKPVTQIYRFLPQDMPDDANGLKKAMDLHLRILWGLLDANAVPKDPPLRLLNDFSNRFSTEAQLQASLSTGPELISHTLVQFGTLMSSSRGAVARHARLVEENMLAYIQVRLSRFGFNRWCPDLRQSPYALYNCACRIVALDTFKQALVANTYEHLGPNVHYAQDTDLLVRLFDHFTFHYMYARYKKESRSPGSVEQELKHSPVYQHRQHLAAARLKFLKENGYPKRYHQLVDPKATSDDEFDTDSNVWLIKRRPERSAEAERFVRILDAKREEYFRQQKSNKWRERIRRVPSSQEDSVFKVLPEHMPVDYFDPEFFNRLQPNVRNRVAVPQVAFLPNVNESLSWCDNERRLNDAQFTRKYGRRVLRRYNMVTDADLEAAHNVEQDLELGDDEGDGDWIDENEPRSEESSNEGNSGSDMSFSASDLEYTSSSSVSATFIPSSGATPGPEDSGNTIGEAATGPPIAGPSGA